MIGFFVKMMRFLVNVLGRNLQNLSESCYNLVEMLTAKVPSKSLDSVQGLNSGSISA